MVQNCLLMLVVDVVVSWLIEMMLLVMTLLMVVNIRRGHRSVAV